MKCVLVKQQIRVYRRNLKSPSLSVDVSEHWSMVSLESRDYVVYLSFLCERSWTT